MSDLTFWRLICCISAPFIVSGMWFFMMLAKYWSDIDLENEQE